MARMRFLFLPSIVVALLCAEAGQADEQSWIIEQTNAVTGDRTLYVSSNGALKISFKRQQYFLVCAPPSWSPMLFSTEKQIYAEALPDFWSKQTSLAWKLTANVHLSDDIKDWKKGKPSCIAGYRMTNLEYHPSQSSAKVLLDSATDIKLASKTAWLFSKISGMPANGVPIRITFLPRSNNAGTKMLETSRIAHITTGNDFYSCPPNLRHASPLEVMTDVTVLKDMTTSLGEGLGSK